MTDTTPWPFAAQSYQSRSLPLDAQRLVNMFVELSPKDAKEQVPVFMCPGLTPFSYLVGSFTSAANHSAGGPVQGMHIFQDQLYAISGSVLVVIDEYGTSTVPPNCTTTNVRGVGNAGTNLGGAVQFADNGTQMVMVDVDGGAWIYQPSGVYSHSTADANAADTAITVLFVGSLNQLASDSDIHVALDDGTFYVGQIEGIVLNGNFYNSFGAFPYVNGLVITINLVAEFPSKATSGANVWFEENVLAEIKDPAFQIPSSVVYFDDYFVFGVKGTNQFFLSALGDGTQYNALDFASAQASSGILLSCVNYHEQLLLMKEFTIEFWYDSGAANFPFARYDGAYVQRGIIGSNAVCQEDNTVLWMGEDLIFYRLEGVQPKRLSTFATEHAWAQYKVTSDLRCFVVTIEGHKFVFLYFPSANKTWCYDISSGADMPLWHERESLGGPYTQPPQYVDGYFEQIIYPGQLTGPVLFSPATQGIIGAFRGGCGINCYGKALFGDRFSPIIAAADFGNFTEYGNLMRAICTAPPLAAKRKRLFLQRFELDIEAGVGTQSVATAYGPTNGSQSTDPMWYLEWSKDGGRTFSPLRKFKSMGNTGRYSTRLRWTRMGQARQWTLRLVSTDPVRRVIIGVYLQAYEGMN